MEFIIFTGTALLVLLCLCITVDAAIYHWRHTWPRLLSFWHSLRLSWRSELRAPGFKIRRKSGPVQSLGRLRATRERYESLRGKDEE